MFNHSFVMTAGVSGQKLCIFLLWQSRTMQSRITLTVPKI